MKKVLFIIISMVLIFGCSGINIKPVQPCIVDKPDGTKIELSTYCQEIKEAGRISYICNLKEKYNFDACYLHRGMEIISKEGLVMRGYTAEEFAEWGKTVKLMIENGISYGTLKDIILSQFTRFNRQLGAQVLILGDMFLELPQDELIPQDDIIMVVSSIDDLVKEVTNMNIWLN